MGYITSEYILELIDGYKMGVWVIEKSIELFGKIRGSFCLDMVATNQVEFKVFEISARIVAWTNPYISGSQYFDLIHQGMSTGQRITIEIKKAWDTGCLGKLLT